MRKVIYLLDQPLDERNHDRFGVQTWIDRGWLLEVWDLTPWAHAKVWRDFVEFHGGPKRFSGYVPVASYRELRNLCSLRGKAECYMDLTGASVQSIRANRALLGTGASRITCRLGTIPAPAGYGRDGIFTRLNKLRRKGYAGACRTMIDALVRMAAARFVRTDLMVVSGAKSVPADGSSIELVKAHNFDYDIFLELRNSDVDPPGRGYAVFLDQDYCFHPEYLYLGIPSLVTPGKYFPAVCSGLRAISDALGVDVRIAAHPRATYRQRGVDYFQGYAIEYGRTAELIRDCSVVVCHGSTAVQFAVLFGKPLVFLTTNELLPTFEGRSSAAMAAELGKSLVNLDEDLERVDWAAEIRVNPEAYPRYRSDYVKMAGSPEIPLWRIVIDHMENRQDGSQDLLAGETVIAAGVEAAPRRRFQGPNEGRET